MTIDEARSLVDLGTAQGGMIPKLCSAIVALRDGVPKVNIGNPRSLAEGDATSIVASQPVPYEPAMPQLVSWRTNSLLAAAS